MPERAPGSPFDSTHGRFHLERMMEKLAIHDGDVDARVAVMARDLSHPYDFLEIADVLSEAGRRDDALEWAQSGLIAFADDERGPDLRLDDFVLGEYLGRGRTDDLVALVWRRFEQRSTAMNYGRLRLWSEQVDRWDELRPRALDRLRADAERSASSARSARSVAERRWSHAPPPPSSYQTLIEVLLHDDAVEEAWSLAVEHGCNQALWMALAKAREQKHPLDAVAVYQREVEHLVDRKQTQTYEAAVDLIGHIVELLRTAGRDPEAYMAEVRHRHRPKTKFLGLLAGAGL